MTQKTISYERHRFPADIISHAVWLYHRFCLSFREVEELLAERGIILTYESVRQWCSWRIAISSPQPALLAGLILFPIRHPFTIHET